MPARPLQTSDVTVVAAKEATPSLAIEADGVIPPGVYQEVFLRVVAPVKLTVPLVARLATDVVPNDALPVFKIDAVGNRPPGACQVVSLRTVVPVTSSSPLELTSVKIPMGALTDVLQEIVSNIGLRAIVSGNDPPGFPDSMS